MSSLSFLGNATSYILIPSSTGTNMGVSDFTIEWYQYQTDNNSFPRIFAIGNYPSTSIGVSIEGGTFYYWANSGIRGSTSAGTFKNTWVHFAIVRNLNITTIYRNGSVFISGFSDTYNYNSANNLVVGNESSVSSSAAFGGYMAYFHIMKGFAKYTSAFTVSNTFPTATAETTVLLMASGSSAKIQNTVLGGNPWIVVGEGTNTITTSPDGINWTGQGANIFKTRGYGAAYGKDGAGNNMWVGFGEGGNLFATSYDGISWSGVPSSILGILGRSINYGNGLWVASGDIGYSVNAIVTSTDGINWTEANNSVFTVRGMSARYLNGIWIALGEGGNTIATSTDGLTWTGLGTSVFTSRGNAATYGNGLWVAVGRGGNTIATSTDAITWTGLGATIFTTQGYDIAYDNGLWIAVGSGGNTIATSTDGTNWTGLGTIIFTNGYAIRKLNNLWFACGGGGNSIATSTDGINWTGQGTTIMNGSGEGITYGNGIYVFTGYSTTGNTIATSTDGFNWTAPYNSVMYYSAQDIAFANGMFISVGKGGNTIATSTDGINWTGRVKNLVFTTSARGGAYANGLWVAMGQGGNTIATSTDGINWTGQGANVFTTYGRSVVYKNNLWVAVGAGGNTVATSTDGITWTGRGAVINNNAQGVEFGKDGSGNNLWVYVGYTNNSGNTLATSTDGITWTGRGLVFSVSGYSVKYIRDGSGNNLWVAVGWGSSNVYTSTNGINWTSKSVLLLSQGRSINYANGLWVYTGYKAGTTDKIATSTDTNTWTLRSSSFITYSGWGVATIPDSITTSNSTITNNSVSTFALLPFPASPASPAQTTNVVCFKEGAQILTADGYKKVEELRKGDLIQTVEHGFVPIDIIGKKQIYHDASANRIKDQLYRCTHAEVFDELVLTGCHSILVEDFFSDEQREKTMEYNKGRVFITDNHYRLPAFLDDRANVYEPAGTYTIYHFALENADYYMNYGVYANGLLVETCSKRYLREYAGMTLL